MKAHGDSGEVRSGNGFWVKVLVGACSTLVVAVTMGVFVIFQSHADDADVQANTKRIVEIERRCAERTLSLSEAINRYASETTRKISNIERSLCLLVQGYKGGCGE